MNESKSDSPAVLFYTSDFLSGTFTMNFDQKGKYITLLCLQHQMGRLKEEDVFSICDSSDTKVLRKFIIDDDGLYYNARMESEIIKRSKFCNSRSNNRTGKVKELCNEYEKDMKNISNSYEKHMENENENINDNVIINTNTVKEEKSKFVPPTIEEVSVYCKEINFTIDPQQFIDHYTITGWKYGKNKVPLKDWKAALRVWKRNNPIAVTPEKRKKIEIVGLHPRTQQ